MKDPLSQRLLGKFSETDAAALNLGVAFQSDMDWKTMMLSFQEKSRLNILGKAGSNNAWASVQLNSKGTLSLLNRRQLLDQEIDFLQEGVLKGNASIAWDFVSGQVKSRLSVSELKPELIRGLIAV